MSTTATASTVPALNLAAIAAALPGQWTAEPQESCANEWRGYLTRADGLRLFAVANDYSNRGKVKFSHNRPRYPMGTSGGTYVTLYGENGGQVSTPSIRCTLTKTPEQMAADIARRLIADAERVDKLAREQIEQRNNHNRQQMETLRAISAAAGFSDIPRDYHSNEARFSVNLNGPQPSDFSRGFGDANVNASTVDFKLSSIPAEKAVALVEWLRANVFAG